jgi:hypothetical protein
MLKKKEKTPDPAAVSSEGLALVGPRVRARCPACSHEAVFDTFEDVKDLLYRGRVHGQRRCPNPECNAHIFFIGREGHGVTTFPPQKAVIEKEGVPPEVLAFLDEAIDCHANGCLTAAAIMVRRTLEEICADKHVTGRSLEERIRALGREIIFPAKLLDGMSALHLLGSDKPHAELSQFQPADEEEVEAGLAFTRELLKAAYQYEKLVDKLEALEKKRRDAKR